MNTLLSWFGITKVEESEVQNGVLQAALDEHKEAGDKAVALAKKSREDACKLSQLAQSALDILDRTGRTRKKL
jgi:hypothetical protein